MSDAHAPSPSIEDLVASYLDERDEHPDLSPEDFSARHPDRPRLLDAILGALRAVSAMSDAAPAEVKRLGAYRIAHEIGRGGMGIVYEAHRDDRRFAIKLLPFALVSGPRGMERFRREVRTLSALDHPNIVSIVDSGVQDGTPYLVMEFVDGQPLSALGPVEPQRAASITEPVARAVQAAHDLGILHRDLKPQNVILRSDGTPVLLDFGLVANEDFASLTSTGDLVGTPRYMAPERIRGDTAGPHSDVYGLGLVLYELVTGCPAFDSTSRQTLAQTVCDGRLTRPGKIAPDIPRDLERIVLTAAANEPGHRFASAGELADDLARFRDGQPVLARPPGVVRRALARARRRPATVAAGVVILALATLAVVSLVERPPIPLSAEDRQESQRLALSAIEHYLDGEEDAARERLARAIDLDPSQPSAAALLAALTGRAPRTEDPLVLTLADGARHVESDPDRADASLARALEIEASNPLALVLRARIARDEHRVADADVLFQAVAPLLPQSAYVRWALAWIDERRGRPLEALAHAELATEMNPQWVRAWSLLAKVHARLGNLEQGLAAIEQANRLAGDGDPHVMNIHAALLEESGRREESRALYRRMLDEDPDDPQTLYNLGFSYDTDHLLREAVDAYERSLERSGDRPDPKTLTALANLYSGASRGTCGQCDTAFDENPDLYDLDRARHYFDRAIRADRGDRSDVHGAFIGIALRFEDRDDVLRMIREQAETHAGTPRGARLARLARQLELRKR